MWDFLKLSDSASLNAVTQMRISNVTFNLFDLNNFLKMFPNLNVLQLSSVKLQRIPQNGLQLNDNEKPIFKKLKTLLFGNQSDSRFLQCFTNAKLTILISREQHFIGSIVWKFLSSQSDLKEIDFCRIASNAAFEFGINPSLVTFKLKRMALDYKSVLDFNGITALILLQPDNFETVALGHIPDPSVYSLIFANLKNLKTLHLMPGSVGSNLSNELILQPLQSITSLRLYDGVNYGFDLKSIEEMTIKVIENLPNLQDLELFVPYKQIYYQAIITNLKNLKCLTIRVTFDTELKNLKYPPVQVLRINCFNFGKNSRIHPPISMLTGGEETGVHETIRFLVYEGITDEEFFVFIRKTFPMLELLEVRKDIARFDHTRVAGIRQVHYRDNDFFPEIMRFT